MKDSLMLPEGRPRWVIISRAITEAVGLSYDDCTSGRFCKGPNDPGFDQRMQTVIKAYPSLKLFLHIVHCLAAQAFKHLQPGIVKAGVWE